MHYSIPPLCQHEISTSYPLFPLFPLYESLVCYFHYRFVHYTIDITFKTNSGRQIQVENDNSMTINP